MSRHEFDGIAWAQLDSFTQMGNIGSEVGRALAAKRRNKLDWMEGAFRRGLDLIDTTAALWAADKSPGLRELLRARELFARSITTDDIDETLEKYFMEFAVAARRRQFS